MPEERKEMIASIDYLRIDYIDVFGDAGISKIPGRFDVELTIVKLDYTFEEINSFYQKKTKFRLVPID